MSHLSPNRFSFPYRVHALAFAVLLSYAADAQLAEPDKTVTTTETDPDADPDPDPDPAKHAPHPVIDLPALEVNARLGSESAKDIPFGLSVAHGDDIEADRLLNVESVLRNTPGVDVNSDGGGNDANIRIRGVGSLNQVSMDDGAVVMNVDGVAMSASHTSLSTFDVDQIEILKGPQGTLFGLNSEAGAVNVTTRRPTRDTEGYLRVEAGEQSQDLQEGAIGGALSEDLAGRFAIRNNGFHSWIENANNGRPMIKPTNTALRGSLLWDAGERTQVLLIMEGQNTRHNAGMEVLRPFGDHPGLDLTPGVFNGNYKDTRRFSLQIDHNLEASRITSITAYTSADFVATKGYDKHLTEALYGTPFEYLATDSSKEHVTSQDLRWSSLPDASIFWVTGVNLRHSRRSFDSLYLSSPNQQQRHFTTDSQAVYGEATVPLNEAFKLTGGLRYSHDNKSYRGLYSTAGMAVDDHRRLGEGYVTGRVALSYALSETTNLYAVVARGHKSRGFNDYATQPIDSRPYKAANVDTVEMGFKQQSADGRFSLSGDVYLNEVKNDHLLGYDINTMAVSTVNANTRSKGAELEGNWRFRNGWVIGAGMTYIDAKITSSATGVSGGNVAAGNRVPDVPYWSGNLNVAYRHELPAFWRISAPAVSARINYRRVGRRPADPQNHFDLTGYQKLDLRIGIENGNAELYAWADNLGNAHYALYGSYAAPGVTIGMPARGRTIGLGISYAF